MTNKVNIELVRSKDGYTSIAEWGEVKVVIEAASIEPGALLHQTIVVLKDAVAWEKNKMEI